jgi:hypothetical protein
VVLLPLLCYARSLTITIHHRLRLHLHLDCMPTGGCLSRRPPRSSSWNRNQNLAVVLFTCAATATGLDPESRPHSRCRSTPSALPRKRIPPSRLAIANLSLFSLLIPTSPFPAAINPRVAAAPTPLPLLPHIFLRQPQMRQHLSHGQQEEEREAQ